MDREGAEGEFDEKGSLSVGRSWRGDEQTVTLRAVDEGGRPQLRFHKYKKGKKLGMRVVTLERETLRATEIREYDADEQLIRIARLTPEAQGEVSEPGRAHAFESPAAKTPPLPPKPLPGKAIRPTPLKPARPKPSPVKPTARPKPVVRPGASIPALPQPRALAAPPGTLLGAAPNGAFATAEEVLRRFGPALGAAKSVTVAGDAGPETWLVRREAAGRKLERAAVVNELAMREVLRSFYGESFEATAAVGFEAGGRAALLERLTPGSTVQHSFRPLAPRERAALATLSLVFGLADHGPERLVWRSDRKPLVSGLRAVRREPRRPAVDESPLIAVEIRLGRVPFVRMNPSLPREDYAEEARRVGSILSAPGFAERFRERLGRAGMTEEEAKGYADAAAANLARFDALLSPYLEAASAVEELTDGGR
ncbi:MAG: hypothetical protein HY553_04495 [Elusimicrobia bacterium]|nr:hypothetical protein [Elusimicrobiota bacterium]